MRTLVIGVGNPLVGDDGVGIHVVRRLQELGLGKHVELEEAATGGLTLVEMFLGFEKVVIVDAIASEALPPGDVMLLTPESLKGTTHLSSPHDTNFATALELLKSAVPDQVPSKIVIVGVGIKWSRIREFSEELSTEVRDAVQKAVEIVIEEIRLS
ncbi:MAG: hydrogenase maturation protease [Methanopyri archaeon]|jgi:hydrogenase maturation protease|nr:hydrogenase maturation protease [Methanopyri archaeon]